MSTLTQQIQGGIGKKLSQVSSVANKILPKTYSNSIVGNIGNNLQSLGGQVVQAIPHGNTYAAPTPSYGIGQDPNRNYITPAMQAGFNQPAGGNTGGSGAGNAGAGSTGQLSANGFPQLPNPDAPNIDFDALIAPALSALEAAIPGIQQGYDQNVSDINAAKQIQLDTNQANVAGQNQILENGRTEQQQSGENAAQEAARQFAEIQQGLQSRYGGTTGTGQFASEIAGQQTLRNIGQTRQQVANAMQQINDKLLQVKTVGDIAARDLEQKATAQIDSAKQQLEASLQDIRSQKATLQMHKAELAANAIQIYQQTVNNVAQANAQFKQQLYAQQLAAQQSLESAQQKGQGIASSFQSTDLTPGVKQGTPVVSNNQYFTPQNEGKGVQVAGQNGINADQLRKLYGLGG